jgi:hypothetical protein
MESSELSREVNNKLQLQVFQVKVDQDERDGVTTLTVATEILKLSAYVNYTCIVGA